MTHFNFRKGYGDPQGTILFLDFFPFVNDENKAFLEMFGQRFRKVSALLVSTLGLLSKARFGWDAFAQEGGACVAYTFISRRFLKYETSN